MDILLFRLLAVLLFVNILAIFYLIRRYFVRKNCLTIQSQGLEEKINILNAENAKEAENKIALEDKIKRYNKLKEITEEIDQSLDLETIGDSLTSSAFSVIARGKGTCILYLLDSQTQKLNLFKTKKEEEGLIVKAKEGDIFDFWVLRHSSPLLVEDIRKDFRFDLEKIGAQAYTRPVSSLISSPLISEHKFLGVFRLDSPLSSFYSQDDLRYLDAICNLGALALENGELFQRMRDLAIHDELTSLFTRHYFLDGLKNECLKGLRQGTSFSLLMLDIDYFKNYNDKFGHISGDIVLKNLSHNITDFLKGLDAVISRFGGEEFCVILPSLGKAKAHQVAEELRVKIEKAKVTLRKQETHITVSIGVVSFPLDGNNADELILKVDKAMYEAKQKGRNRVCIT
ncbi:MAG: sensor domain-containing diguanylate cyclase [Candidatus Omnitrophica bacterium]|nr:sensor domain-containing diguanylate cyclase [Candidatus Omnitrophota bacterium]MDD5592005.1 sensor domain-containing diguanylate cyclase [Candidatus Omnitrophota bacterium]